MKKQNDTLWKGILEPFFYDFLRLVDPVLAATINQDRPIVFMDNELYLQAPSAEEIFERRIVDKLVKLYTTEGSEKWILLHLEVQDKYTKDFSERMYGYFYRLYDKHKRPITAYAIFTEPNKIKRDNVFKMNCGGTKLEYTFNTYKIALQDENVLINHANPFALVILIAKQTELKKRYNDRQEFDRVLLADKLKIAALILERNLEDTKKRILMNFLFYYINFEFQETKLNFEHKINLLTNKNTPNMTIEDILIGQAELRGKRLGIKEAQEAEIARLIRKQGLTDDQIVDFAEVSHSLVKRIRKKTEKIN